MKWILLFAFTTLAHAQAQTSYLKEVDKVKSLSWDGSSYRISLNNHERPFVINGKNEVIPCLENAEKAEMPVLVEIDTNIPMIRSCKLYTPGIIKQSVQAQEETPEEAVKAPSIPKR